ncbi:hypothetical protein [Pseudonocardia abyssalis]|uniref:Uncharacterized protein n=1 Tax=Pseudonocardia abyssalis TaxID=2792008 RepID=A0ABS6UK72_9PSEU|nr:hypothetical protein [Pseudonocardia abyssalis]MBW0116442.1 hypothetical protein [Pseudonocardia abyssalis]MBW0132666.1 hypothetical protein [Pseudonocardia abyssalis]
MTSPLLRREPIDDVEPGPGGGPKKTPGTESEAGAPGSHVVNLFAVLLCLLIAFVLNQGMRNAARPR